MTENNSSAPLNAFEKWYSDYHNDACDNHGGIDCTNPKGIAEDTWEACASLLAPQAEVQAQPADALDATDRECLAIGRALNRAAGELPADGEIHIEIENGAGSVSVYEPSRNEWRCIDSGDVFSAQINEAIDAAMASQAEKEGA